jgi:large subunit ribosomal protein L9
MQIILLERVEKLGKLGDVVSVKPGYARNYLLPAGKALRANKANMEKFETERSERELRNADAKTAADGKAKSMSGLTVALVRAASEMGQLFGSVSSRDIADAVVSAGHDLDKHQVNMDKSIKTLGLFPIRVSLHAEVDAIVTVNVARSLEEAETQARTGQAVVATDDKALVEEQKTVSKNSADTDATSDVENETAELPTSKTVLDETNDEQKAS